MNGATTSTERRPPAWTRVLARQWRLVRLRHGRELLALAVGAVLATSLRLAASFPAQGNVTLVELVLRTPLLAILHVVAFLWGGAVWSAEGPSNRQYHWSLPVRRPSHDLTRVLVGGGWFFASLGAGLLVGGLAFAAAGRGIVPGSPGLLGLVGLALATSYLLGTVPALVTDHPYRWMFGVGIGYLVLRMVVGTLAARGLVPDAAAAGLDRLADGSLGFNAYLFAPQEIAGVSEQAVSPHPGGALLLWVALAVAAVVGLSFLHLERTRGAER